MKLILPLSVGIPKVRVEDRVWYANLNAYRNAHYQLLNQVKILYKEYVHFAITEWEFDGLLKELRPPLIFIYTYYPGSYRKTDLLNVLSIVGKFTEDALTELNIIPDDNYKIIPAINFRLGSVDKDNPRVELVIDEYR